MFLVAGTVAAMGALVTVNAVWLYGPYEPAAATSFSQPDWYIGFLEGSVRLFPDWEPHIGSYMLPNPFYSGVLIPSIIFAVLFAVPFIERRYTKDTGEHHLLDRPRDAPVRTASGVAGLSVIVLLFVGGAQDIVAETISVSVGHVTAALQISLLVLPPVTWLITYRLCRALRDRPPPERTERASLVDREADGGYHDAGYDAATRDEARAAEDAEDHVMTATGSEAE